MCFTVMVHFKYLLEELGIARDEKELVDRYLESVASSADLMEPCTLEVIRTLSDRYSIHLASNGIEKTQTKRITAFIPYVNKVYISESIGVIKPTPAFYSYMLKDLKCAPKNCLMIGDSITNDIVGAKRAGMATCFFNPKHKEVKCFLCGFCFFGQGYRQ